ncbi:MAG: phosphoglucomutase/phosphomannomutase family protein [Bacilli bacterium]
MIKFGTGGFRGVISDTFNKENIQLIAQALSNIIKDENSSTPIIIGYDNRFMSDFAARWFGEVLAGNDIHCFIYEQSVPTPSVMSATRDLRNDYGVMITASHNPYYFNGIKLFTKKGYDADVNFTNKLEKYVNEVKEVKTISYLEAKRKWLIQSYSNTNMYLSHIKTFIDPSIKNNNLKIIYNNMCGVGVVGLLPLAKEMKIKQFDVIHKEHDAFFNFNLPNPTYEAFKDDGFIEKVVSNHYDCGLATDSDGDRLGVIDELGNYVSNNEILATLYYYLITKRGMKGDIVKNCATSILVDKVANKLGYKCHEVDVGFKNITHGMDEYDALIGGESSGGLTLKGYLYGKDSVFSSMLFMEMIIKEGLPVSQIIQNVKDFADYKHVFIEDTLPLRLDSEKVINVLKDNPPKFSSPLLDYKHFTRNFKYYFKDDCWILIRLSGTEPSFRIFVEFLDEENGRLAIEEIKNYIENIQLKIEGGKNNE